MEKRPYLPPKIELISQEYVDSITPLLMSGPSCYNSCYSACYSSGCHTTCYTPPCSHTPCHSLCGSYSPCHSTWGDPSLLTVIPYPYGSVFSVTANYDSFPWDDGTPQGQLHDLWSAQSADNKWVEHIAVYQGYYLIACTSTFGSTGDYVKFFMSTHEDSLDYGVAIDCIIADIKNPSDPGCNEWGHTDGNCVLEFETDNYYYEIEQNPGTDEWKSEWANMRVQAALNTGTNCLT